MTFAGKKGGCGGENEVGEEEEEEEEEEAKYAPPRHNGRMRRAA